MIRLASRAAFRPQPLHYLQVEQARPSTFNRLAIDVLWAAALTILAVEILVAIGV